MKSRAIPFRPKLEGFFRVRFYRAASSISSDMADDAVEQLIASEVTTESFYLFEMIAKCRSTDHMRLITEHLSIESDNKSISVSISFQ